MLHTSRLARMLLFYALVCVVTLGRVVTGACDRSRRYLVSVNSSQVHVWPGEEVDLYCRLATDSGCRWLKGDQVLGEACQLSTSERGLIKCVQGEEVVGSVHLREPKPSDVVRAHPGNDTSREEGHDLSYQNGSTESTSLKTQKTSFLCSDTGKIIEKTRLCDGIMHCSNGEDEQECEPPCGAPSVREHSTLSTPETKVYKDGAEVKYACESGFGFRNSLNWFRRTCQRGRWSDESPSCHENVALNQPVVVEGHVIGGRCLQVVNDGISDNWCMLMPTTQPQSIAVQLAANVSVSQVLVRFFNERHEVSLRDMNRIRASVQCQCANSSVAASNPSLSGLAVCSCPVGSLTGPVEIVVSKELSTFKSLSVAEIAAFKASAPDEAGGGDSCALLDQPAYGEYEPAGDGSVRLVCQPGYSANCTDVTPCRDVASGAVRLSCRPLTCPPPPAIPHAVVQAENGTAWMAVTEYACAAGYQLYPPEQRTTAVCEDGLWSLSHVVCLPETDIRVVALRMSQQHERSVSALRRELEALLSEQQQQLVKQLNQTQDRLKNIQEQFDETDRQLDRLQSKVDRMQSKVDSNSRRYYG
ncbi:uncharacterized protein LOC119105716 [Pollicipes pollicipes]|uniref:uncharacterized protein LOC119105716 n=1 Tax=Pollicipes pollicipes TaxID=41117 RepID=UPI00188522A7|nr:uncharacterized protein LOC119105716 [Pollicipes pollicipes]